MPLTAKYSKKQRKAIKDASEARAKQKRAKATTMPIASDAKNFEQRYNKVCEAFEKLFISPASLLQSSFHNDKKFVPARNILGSHKPTDPAGLRWDPVYQSTYRWYDQESNEVYRM